MLRYISCLEEVMRMSFWRNCLWWRRWLAGKPVAAAFSAGLLAVVWQAEFRKESEVETPLADKPGSPGAQLDKIRTIGSNTWLNLGRPAPDPVYGPSSGRSWSRKMAFAPDLRGAFFYGESRMGASSVRAGKRFYNDDLYFYDINAHAWVCCYPGTLLDEPGQGLKFDEVSGCETDRNGNILPVAASVHAYWAGDYDTDRKEFMFMPSPASMGWKLQADLVKFRKYLVNDPRWSHQHSPYYYSSKTGKFSRRRTVSSCAGANVDNALFYSPKQKKAVYFYGGVWLYDYSANAWRKAAAEGGGSGAYCYDSRRDQVYVVMANRSAGGTNQLSIFSVESSKWIKPQTKGDCGVWLDSNDAFFTYDSVNDVALMYYKSRHYVYDPAEGKWSVLPASLQESVDWEAGGGFYDPDLNVHFYFNARAGKDLPGNMWVYRYAPAPQPADDKAK